MSKKKWRPVDWDSCPKCGDDIVYVCTDAILGEAYDSDDAECMNCGEKGSVVVDEDTAYIEWEYNQPNAATQTATTKQKTA